MLTPDGIARFHRGALAQDGAETLQALLAHLVEGGIAGDDIGKPRLERVAHRVFVGGLGMCAGHATAGQQQCNGSRGARGAGAGG